MPHAGPPPPVTHRRVFVIGATGTIGRATVRALLRQGHEVVCFVRPRAGAGDGLPVGATVRHGDVTDPASLARDGFGPDEVDRQLMRRVWMRRKRMTAARKISHRNCY